MVAKCKVSTSSPHFSIDFSPFLTITLAIGLVQDLFYCPALQSSLAQFTEKVMVARRQVESSPHFSQFSPVSHNLIRCRTKQGVGASNLMSLNSMKAVTATSHRKTGNGSIATKLPTNSAYAMAIS